MVFPLYDENPFKWPVLPYATWALIAVNVGIFLIQTVFLDDAAATAMVRAFGATPAALFHHVPQPGPLPAELTLVTSMFLHANWLHLQGNMVYLSATTSRRRSDRAAFSAFIFSPAPPRRSSTAPSTRS
jgi:membrane associated rhomboid family serine protease